jgi:hypothetical protein
MAGFVRCE